MVQVGETCGEVLDTMMRGLHCKRIEVDEVWCYVGKKQRHVNPTDNPDKVGDFWTFVAIDAAATLVPTHRFGKRDVATAYNFIMDLAYDGSRAPSFTLPGETRRRGKMQST